MSIPVAVDQVAGEVARRGFGYLLTVSDDGRPHLVALRPTIDDRVGVDVLRFDTGSGRAARNAGARPHVSIVFPPAPHSDGYSLVIDGDAEVGDGFVTVTPTGAVLHRPAP